jgi:hypothetical protein
MEVRSCGVEAQKIILNKVSAKRLHDIDNALNCIEFISDLIEEGYLFQDSKAQERRASFRKSIDLLRNELSKLEHDLGK